MNANPRIVFYGTPDFAVASLDALIRSGYPVVGVVTAPDRPAGRGLHLSLSAVKQYALSANLPLYQPVNLKSDLFLSQLRELKPDIQVIVAFRMLPRVVWEIPPYGSFNLHASLLPQYRGAAPINWAIINGEQVTGVTTFFLNDQIDTGEILQQEAVSIGSTETAGELHDRLKEAGARLVVSTIRGILAGGMVPLLQSQLTDGSEPLRLAPKISKMDTMIHWNEHIDRVYNRIRAFIPHPGSSTVIPLQKEELAVKILKAKKGDSVEPSGKIEPGQLVTDRKTYLHVYAQGGYIDIQTIQPAGRSAMQVGDFLNGFGRKLR